MNNQIEKDSSQSDMNKLKMQLNKQRRDLLKALCDILTALGLINKFNGQAGAFCGVIASLIPLYELW